MHQTKQVVIHEADCPFCNNIHRVVVRGGRLQYISHLRKVGVGKLSVCPGSSYRVSMPIREHQLSQIVNE